MGPYAFGSGELGSTPELDGLLAGAGYRVRSSDLRHVAQSLELLDSATVGHASATASDLPHFNPSDLAAWVDSMLSEISPSSLSNPNQPQPSTWTDDILPPHHHQQQIPILPLEATAAAEDREVEEEEEEEEDSGIRLVHLLMSCADSIHRGDHHLAASLIDEMRLILSRVSPTLAIVKVASSFAHALSLRLTTTTTLNHNQSQAELDILYHHYYESSPYLKFAHFTANQAILEAFDGCDRVHVVDLALMQGLQWPALLQALALRPGGPPSLRLTAVGPPSPDGQDPLRDVGLRLAHLARSLRLPFSFRGLAASRLHDLRPWMLRPSPGETIAVNSVLQLHRLLADGTASAHSVLSWLAALNPAIVTVVEQEADHNKPDFIDRFTEALFYYSTVFDSLDAGRAQHRQSAALAELHLQREICDIICCEGPSRIERHEPLAKWRARMGRAGFSPVHLGSNAFKQASMLLTLFSGEGYCVDEVDGCLTLGWHSRPLISASAWRAAAAPAPAVVAEQPCSNITVNSSARDTTTTTNNASSSSSSCSNNNNSNSNVVKNGSDHDRDIVYM